MPQNLVDDEPRLMLAYWQTTSHNLKINHNNGVIMNTMASQITSSRLFTQPLIHAQIKENIEAPRHWPLCGEFTGDRWMPHTKVQ